jgi:dihydroxyacetone kinase
VDVVLAAAGDAWADRGSGTSGALWGVLLNTVAESLHGVTVPTPAQLVNALATAADRVASIGKSAVGDKTMLDALAPFVDELRARVTTGEDLASAWQTAARVAHERALETAQLRPKVGRARPLAERSLGSPDPGAISMALCLIAAGAALSTEPKNDSETETT